ncbi:MAG: GIY-YIG nuclease family protein [bacterium]
MFTVYVLRSEDGRLYKGMTNNLVRRFKEHGCGKTKTTSTMQNLKIVYTEEYENFDGARSRELYLKTASGRRFLKTVLPS